MSQSCPSKDSNTGVATGQGLRFLMHCVGGVWKEWETHRMKGVGDCI